MEDDVSHEVTAVEAPPPPPEPRANETAQDVGAGCDGKSDAPLDLSSEHWDIDSISGLGALRMLISALQTLADAMGDVPPTPPVSRPTTPRHDDSAPRRSSSNDTPCPMEIGSPEAHPHEPITIEHGAHAEDISIQRIALARRFFSKVAPPFSVADYLLRLHQWCPHSPGVYLTAAAYIQRLCVADLMVPATNRTVHRLSLAAIRVASKAVEDNKWTQDRFAKVAGVSKTQLLNLEITLCFLLDFDLGVNAEMLAKKMFLLQQAAKQGMGVKGRLSDEFRLKLPARMRRATFG